jgi:hypothetical protein
MHGQGHCAYEDGKVYEGTFVDDQREHYGTMKWYSVLYFV